ncbi:MAG TPA: SDR family NAD(P)-dependent oxidoreductase, partial [Polyangiales bacterium]|nr:SDR family NAD(P)-dependent oxidoreductase [Polyangiales bacterium]
LPLPTYAFQRQRHWLEPVAHKDARALGLVAAEHPLLGAMTPLADSDGYMFSSRLTLSEHAWLKDHAVQGNVLMPGTGILELALHAARTAGLASVSELTLEQPLRLSEGGAVQLQVTVGALDDQQQRSLSIHTRHDDGVWQRNASGRLSAHSDTLEPPELAELRAWDLTGAEAIEVDGLYERLQAQGLEYGPAFQGLRSLHCDARGVAYSRVRLDDKWRSQAGLYGVHPALLDAALHGLVLLGQRDGMADIRLPFLWSQVQLYAAGATELRVRTQLQVRESAGADESHQLVASIHVADGSGEPVASIQALHVRPLPASALRPRSALSESLYRVELQPVVVPAHEAATGVVVGGDRRLAQQLGLAWYPDMEQLLAAEPSQRVIFDMTCQPWVDGVDGLVDAALQETAQVLVQLQQCLSEPRLGDSELLWITSSAMGSGADWDVADLSHAPLVGLLRSVRSEHPERSLRLIDVGNTADLDPTLLAQALLSDSEPELALRSGVALGARLCAAHTPRLDTLDLEHAPEVWRVAVKERARLDAFVLEAVAPAALADNQVRVSVRAAGLNFRDVMTALGLVPDGALGVECAGVVLEVGASVHGLQPGDRVMGMAPGAFGNEVCTDARLLARIPRSLSFAQAATMPAVYLTALHAFDDLAQLGADDKVLIHAAAGGVGMAAIQLARAVGAEVFATASERKWPVLRAQGLDDAHIASSRDLSFERKWLDHTQGRGFDVILNSLAREYVDASLRLLPRGGTFLEMGKTDIRDASALSELYPAVRYRAFDLMDSAGIERVGQLLHKLVKLYEAGLVTPLPFAAYDVRHTASAFRFMAQAKHVGKIVFSFPQPLGTGPALITGGTGELGAVLAQHLVREHGVEHVVLASRRGDQAPGAQQLVETLYELGAQRVELVACDVSQRAAIAQLLATLPELDSVFHLSAVLDDGLLESQTPERVARVFAAKLGGALHLHELTRERELSAFVLFSSAAGTLGNAGQSTYAAANAALDALAMHRRKRGLAGTSLAWGLWQPSVSDLTSQLKAADLARIARSGILPLEAAEGMLLLDAALGSADAHLVPAKLSLSQLQRQHGHSAPPALLRALLRPGLRRAVASKHDQGALRERLAGLSETARMSALIEIVQSELSAVLGLPGAGAVDPDREMKLLGLDSLMAVELRNRLSTQVAVTLPATLAFDHPTPRAIARLIDSKLVSNVGPKLSKIELDALAEWLQATTPQQVEDVGVRSALTLLRDKLQPMLTLRMHVDTPNDEDGAGALLEDRASLME